MEVNVLFEELYQSLIEREHNLSIWSFRNASKYESPYSTGRHQMFKRNNVASNTVTSESTIISNQLSIRSEYSVESEITIKSTRGEQHITTISQGEDVQSINEEPKKENNCEVSEPKYSTSIADEVLCLDDHEPEGSNSHDTYEPVICLDSHEPEGSNSHDTYELTDGYQSAESKMSDVFRLCRGCKNLNKKVRRLKRPSITKDQWTTDPKPWYSKSWMFVNQRSARGSKKTLQRDLGSVVKKLQNMQISECSPSTGTYLKCCRSHVFLKRNVRVCEVKQKRLLFENKGEKKRKLSNARQKSRRPKKFRSSSQTEIVPQTGRKSHKPYCFALDSSHERDGNAGPEIIKSNSEIKKIGRNSLRSQSETQKQSTSGRMLGHISWPGFVPPLHSHERVVTDQPLLNKSIEHDTQRPSVHAVEVLSFREQLQKLTMGHVKSAIIKYN